MSELVRPFPVVGRRMVRAYLDLSRLEQATKPEDVRDLGPIDRIPRPWDVASITDVELRLEVWQWLDAVVDWINTEYAWQVTDIIPACWAEHPHLVHDLGTLADQRRRAGLAATSDALEDWQRYSLPYFLDRTKNRLKGMCEAHHRPAVGTARVASYRDADVAAARRALFQQDVANLPHESGHPQSPVGVRARLALVDGQIVDPETGEVPWHE